MSYRYPLRNLFSGEVHDPVGDLFAVLSRGDIISFAGGLPDGALFDYDAIRASFDHVLTNDARRALQYASTEGDPSLREEAARRLSRHVPTHADQIQITSGSQEGIHLAAQVMLDPGDVVLVEEPTYLAAVQAFLLGGATLIGVPTDADGVLPDALERAIAQHRPKLVYLIPSYANPSGKTMPLARRRQVAEVLRRTAVPLLEDDPYGALCFEGEPLPPIASLPGMSERTLLLNSVSKVMAPGVRVGWIRGEGEIMKIIGIAKAAVTLQSPAINQLAVAHYLANNDLDAHVRHVSGIYRERRDAMYSGLRAMLPSGADVTRPTGGMFCWVTLNDGSDTQPLLDVAIRHQVAFVPGWAFFATTPDRSTMRLSYVTNSPAMIAEGLARLGAALAERATLAGRPHPARATV